jgi:hypothetical protein
MPAPDQDLPPGEIQFFDAFEPGLKDGTYRIDVTQSITAANASIDPAEQFFVVQGPRFTIDPADVHTVFPPNGATAVFEEVLPHIVLNKRLLPWERDIPGCGDNVPWMALLVFQDGELLGPVGGGNYAQTLTVDQLLATTDPNVRKPQPTDGSVSDDEKKLNCQAITFNSSLFAQIVPTARELPYLAHARQVNTGAMALFGYKDDGWFSVVVANRFPQAGTVAAAAKSIVHLVSLEGFGDLLGGNAPVAPSQAQIQMVSLASWTFSCLADPAQTFGGLAQNLAYDPNNNFSLRPANSLLFRVPFTTSSSTDPMTVAAQQRLTDGYVALGYHAPSGEDGFAWYRGPCAPAVPNAVPGAAAFETADAAIIYDPATGVFDLSLATAWQAGRSLALANQPFATALMRVRLAANAVIEKLSAPAKADLHERLAALFKADAIETIRDASAAGNLQPAPRAPGASAAPSAPPVLALRALLADPAVQAQLVAAVEGNSDAEAVGDWLGQLLLLRNLPFVHLVPDARMLPIESIRFFYLDQNWISALLDGALGIGLGTSRESAIQAALSQELEKMAQTAALAWRADQLGQTPPPAAVIPAAGFLLRSALASGWPGLGVTGTSKGTSVPLLRLEHLAPNVLVALFNGVPDTITLSEPQEGLEFGVNDDGEVFSRTISSGIVTAGVAVPVFNAATPTAASTAIRAGGLRVLNVSSDPNPPNTPPTTPLDLIELLAKALSVAPAAIGPADFAVQMVKGPEELVFSLNPPAKPT